VDEEHEDDEEAACSSCDFPESECECCTHCDSYPCEHECSVCGDCRMAGCSCCQECEETYCCCCEVCGGNSNWCDCCTDCGCSECECSRFGHSQSTPWEKRGINVSATGASSDWGDTWKVDHNNIDPVQCAANFYLLEAMIAGAAWPTLKVKPVEISKEADERFFEMMGVTTSEEKAKLEVARARMIEERRYADPLFGLGWLTTIARQRQKELVDRILPSLVNYGHMAIGGELRHHVGVGGSVLNNSDRDAAWTGWKKVHEAVGNQALADAAELFHEFDSDGYGGPPWANCCMVLFDFLEGNLGPDGPEGEINRRMFIDRIWTLQHNGGSFLNKICWTTTNHPGWELRSMNKLLDAHASNPPGFRTMFKVADEPTQDLIREMAELANVLLDEKIEWMDKPKVRTACRWCWGNPEHGHVSIGCHGLNPKYAGQISGGVTKTVEEDEWHEYDWTKWEKPEAHIVDTNGVYHVKTSDKFELDMGITATWGSDGLERHFNATFTGNQFVKGTKKINFATIIGAPGMKMLKDAVAQGRVGEIYFSFHVSDASKPGHYKHVICQFSDWFYPSGQNGFMRKIDNKYTLPEFIHTFLPYMVSEVVLDTKETSSVK
jgi:hypothetical protein